MRTAGTAKDDRIHVRLPTAEKEKIHSYAKSLGLNDSEFMRRLAILYCALDSFKEDINFFNFVERNREVLDKLVKSFDKL
ncbi:MAG: hypothetical protein LBQ00_03475 [Syntrophobacterales bacterium]|jgi:hypothetical protein|nr:hypothetical protein [Syntrophobacterales bacterium]